MILRSWFPTFTAWFVAWRNNLSIGGKALTALFVASIPALGAPESPLAVLAIASLAFLAVVGIANHYYRPHLRSAQPVRETTTQGDRLDLVVEIENSSSRSAFDLQFQLTDAPESWEILATPEPLEVLLPKERTRILFSIRANRRGVYGLPRLVTSSAFPLNLVRRSHRSALRGEVCVQPAFEPLASVEAVTADQQHTGEQMLLSLQNGHSADYAGSREYQPGVAVRRWDYASWARLQRPVVREFADEQQTTFDVLLDDWLRGREPGQLAAFEAMLSLTAALSHWFTGNNCRIASLIIGDEIIQPSGDGAGQHELVLETLTRMQPGNQSRAGDMVAAADAAFAGVPSTILLTTCWDDDSRELRRRLEDHGRSVKAFAVAPAALAGGDVHLVDPNEVLARRVTTL